MFSDVAICVIDCTITLKVILKNLSIASIPLITTKFFIMYIRFYALVILALCFSLSSRAQCSGNIALHSQAEVDAFPSTYGCSRVGSLQIVDTNDVTNLDSLYQLTSVGTLNIVRNSQLSDIGGLSHLTTATTTIAVAVNPKLQDLSGFSSLTTVGSLLSIGSNPKLVSLYGLEQLTSVGTLEIVFCDLLTDLAPLSGLTSTRGDLTLRGNKALTSLSGLNNITSVSGLLRIEANSALTSVNGINSLTGTTLLWILDNPELLNVDGFSSLRSPGLLTITGNPKLVNLDGFSSMQYASTTHIENNILLNNINGLSAVTAIYGNLFIKGNTSLTSLNGLQSLTKIQGEASEGRLEISGNSLLQNVDSLSSLVSMGGAEKYLFVTNNPALTRACGLYPLLNQGMNCSPGVSCAHITISGDGPGVSEESIRAGGPCSGSHQNPACDGTIRLNSQADVDAFPSNYGCSRISGTLEIFNAADVTNLDSLYQLTSVGTLTIVSNPHLASLGGLSNITDVSALHLSSNPEIQDLSGFSALVSATNMIDIASNAKLASLRGLEHLSTVGTLSIAFCNMLTDVTLPGVTRTGGDLVLRGNNGLISLDGLGNVRTVDGLLRIEANASLTYTHGLTNLTSTGSLWVVDNPVLLDVDGFSELTSTGILTITGNSKLANLDGFSSLTSASTTHIENNPLLSNLNGLSGLTAIYGNLFINGNAALTNFNGLQSLTKIQGDAILGEGRLEISGNSSLQNVDSLSSLVSMGGADKYLVVTNNPNLTKACGLYPLIQNGMNCSSGTSCAHITISGNGPGVTEQSIREGGPCDHSGEPGQPTNLVFSKVTGVTLRLSFTPPSTPPSGGYLVLMRHHEAPYPEEGPVDGTAYEVGDVIGNSTIVVSTGLETVADIVWLSPNTPYYFDIFSYTSSNHYVIANYLEGMQETGDPEPPRNNTLVFSNVTDNTMTVSFVTDSTVDGYLTIMRAHNSSYPDEVPEDGVEYNVGNVIGNSTIVVGKGTASSNDIIWLDPDVDYFFEVLSYTNTNGYFDYDAEHPQSGHQRTNSSTTTMAYPNPFIDNITIPFTVTEENTHVNIVIFDQLGRMVSEVTSQRFPPGKHEVVWDRNDLHGRRVIDGLYMYAIKSTEKNRSAQGMVVAK